MPTLLASGQQLHCKQLFQQCFGDTCKACQKPTSMIMWIQPSVSSATMSAHFAVREVLHKERPEYRPGAQKLSTHQHTIIKQLLAAHGDDVEVSQCGDANHCLHCAWSLRTYAVMHCMAPGANARLRLCWAGHCQDFNRPDSGCWRPNFCPSCKA